MAQRPTSGISGVDDLVDGLRVGDNVVWIAPRRLWPSLIGPFVEQTIARGLCYVTVDSTPEEVLRRVPEARTEKLTMVDFHSAAADGTASAASMAVPDVDLRAPEDPRDLGSAQLLMKELEDQLEPGIGYVFDSLTGMQQMWDAEGALSFFLAHCPRLYDLDTVAYWVLDPDEHDQAFVERIKQITQVILEISERDGTLSVRVVKADARAPQVVGRTATVRESERALIVSPPEATGKPVMGEALKRRRMERGMSQTELARRLGITPSALSQAERGKRGLSADTMRVAWRELGIDDETNEAVARPSYVLARRGARHLETVIAGIEGEKVLEQPSGFEVHLMAFAPGASGRRPPIATKRPEFVMVTEGVLQIRIGDAKEVLHAGDAIYIGTQPLNGWSNPGPTVTRVLWAVVP